MALRRALPILALLLSQTVASHAQTPPLFSLTGSTSVTAGADEKSIVGERRTVQQFLLIAPAAATIQKQSARSRFDLRYWPEFELFGSDLHLDSWNHRGRLLFSHKLTRRWRFDLGDSFLSTRDPSRSLGNTYLLLPRDRYRENSAYASVDFDISPRTTWSFRFDQTVVRYGLPDDLRRNFFDQNGSAWTTSIARQMTPRGRMTATYSFLRASLRSIESDTGVNLAGVAAPIQSVNFGYILERPGFGLGGSAGVLFSNGFSYLMSAHAVKQLGGAWVDAGYSRSLSFYSAFAPEPVVTGVVEEPFAGGLLLGNIFQSVTVGVRGQHKRFGLQLRGTASWNASRASQLDSRSFVGLGRVTYRLTDRLVLLAAAEVYRQNLNELVGIPFARRRVFGGIEFDIARRHAADVAASGMNQEPQK